MTQGRGDIDERWADEPLTLPLKVAGALVLVWWALLGWQALRWWPQADARRDAVSGIAHVERDAGGDISALVVGSGTQALRFTCAPRGRWQWKVLLVPVIECRDGDVLAVADGRQVQVRYDNPSAGEGGFARLLELDVDGQPHWTLGDSVGSFGWLVFRGAFAGLLLFLPGWWLHRVSRRRAA